MYISKWRTILGGYVDPIPSIYSLWLEAQSAVKSNDVQLIREYENLIYLLHNSYVSPKARLGKEVKFAYGGIGVVVHGQSVIGDYVSIGQGVTVGANPGSVRPLADGTPCFVPWIDDYAVIGPGSRVLGGIEIGRFSIIGANAVVTNSVEPLTIWAGSPARKIGLLTAENCLKYKGLWKGFIPNSNDLVRKISHESSKIGNNSISGNIG